MDKEIFEAIQELRKIGIIDVHVHFRDGNLRYKYTIGEGLRHAKALGFDIVCDMPNTDPLLISEEVFISRLEAAKRSAHQGVKYMVWVGLTVDPKQIAKAVYLWKKYPEVVGLKMFAGKSIGNLAIIAEEDQRIVYQALVRLDYTGPVAVHCEEEKYIKESLFDPKNPWTHALARPEIAETSSISQQIKLLVETGFIGWLHVCHVSCHESVNIIDAAKKKGVRISCGITPQALLYSVEKMKGMGKFRSLILKCNPSIKTENNRLLLIEDLRNGRIDLIETDHAPHTVSDKIKSYTSGVMSLFMMPVLYAELKKWNFADWQIKELLRENALKIFTKIKI